MDIAEEITELKPLRTLGLNRSIMFLDGLFTGHIIDMTLYEPSAHKIDN